MVAHPPAVATDRYRVYPTGMDPQTIAIVSIGVAILGVLLGAVVPIGIALIRRVDRLTQVVTALANHRHDAEGAPTFTVPAD